MGNFSNNEAEEFTQQIDNNKKSIENLNETILLQTDELIINSLQNTIEELKTETEKIESQLSKLQSQSAVTEYNPTPEQIIGYIYAILHSPTYREKYAVFLKFDFPRIPFPETLTTFETLSKLGWQLIQVHLLNEIPQGNDYENIAVYTGEGNNEVEKPEYKDNKLYINKEQYFDNVPKAVYEFKIGAYQVLYKYLKDRKGRNLIYDEIINIENIGKSLKFTISQKELIDKQTHNWI